MHNVIKSHPHTRWVTYTLENNSTTEVSPSGVRVLSPMLVSPAQGSSTKKIIPQSIWLSRPAELNCRSLTGRRETDFTFNREHKIPWQKQSFDRYLGQTPWKESYDQPRQHIKKQRHYFANKGPSSQGCGFSSGHVWM